MDVGVLVLRALSYCAALHAAGVPLFISAFGNGLTRSRQSTVRLASRGAWLGLASVTLYQLAEPLRLTGDVEGLLDGSLQMELLASPLGTTTVIRALGLVLIAMGSRRWDGVGPTSAVIGAALVAASFAFMGHTTDYGERWLTVPALLIHVLIVAFWFGSLLPLYRASGIEEGATNGEVVERFSRVAALIVPVILVAGVAIAAVLLPSLASFKTSYGLLLLAKIVGFCFVLALAALNKLRLGPLLRQGNVRALEVFRVVVRIEWILIAGIIALTATMTGLFSPEH